VLKLAGYSALHIVAGETPADYRKMFNDLSGQDVRRISRYAAFAMSGAHRCQQNAGAISSDCALYLCSEQSNLGDTAKLIHSITIDKRPPTPFDFLAVSSNITGFHVARQLGLDGPNLTLARSDASLEAGLELAMLGLPRHRSTLLGYVEDCAWPLRQQHQRVCWPAELPMAECSHWLYFDQDCEQPRAIIESCQRYRSRDDMVAGLRDLIDPETLVSFGLRVDTTEGRRWQEQLGLPRRFDYLDGPVFSKGLSAYVLCRFAERGMPGRLLHLNSTASGECFATIMRVL
jgi:hypothetical protein